MNLHEELDRLTEEIANCEDAIEYAQLVSDCEDVVDILTDRLNDLQVEYDNIHMQVECIEAAEQQEIYLDYQRASA